MKWSALIMIIAAFASCKSNTSSEETEVTNAQTPVTVTSVGKAPMIEYVDLNATATFLQKNYVKANVNGYILKVNTQLGKYVTEGQLLFVLKTKEAQAIGNAVNKLDPSFKFSGTNNIKSTAHGFINQLNHQAGDYVQDGEQLAIINDMNSFAFVMELPFELRPYVINKTNVIVTLPDHTQLTGHIGSAMPTVDPAAQTQNVIVTVNTERVIPENLIARVRIIKSDHSNAPSLPKAAILTNDVQSEYWVMKMIDSVTAIKTVIHKGVETTDRVEILSPVFSADDKIVLTGNFGLPDTARVRITGVVR